MLLAKDQLTSISRNLNYLKFIVGIFALAWAVSSVAETSGNFDLLRLRSSTLPASCSGGQLRRDTSDGKLAFCVGSTFTKVLELGSTLPVANGGTNQTSYTVGDILYASASGVLSKLSTSTLGYVLTDNGAGVAPSWQPLGAVGTPNGVVAYNFLVNSAFDYWQVGTSVATTDTGGATPGIVTAYQADQWYSYNQLGAGTIEGVLTYSQVTGVTNGSKYGASFKITTAGTGTFNVKSAPLAIQPLSNAASMSLYNNTASFGILVKALGNTNQVTLVIKYTTTEAKPDMSSGGTTLSAATCNVNSSTFTNCKLENVAIGTSMTTSGIISVAVMETGVSSGTTFDVNNGFVLEQGMLNIGSTVAPWSRQNNSPERELAACQYFYEKSYDTTVAPGTVSSAGEWALIMPSTSMQAYVPFKVTKRATPTMTMYSNNSGTSGKFYDNVAAADVTGSFAVPGVNGALTSGTSVANHGNSFHWVADSRM